MRSKSGSCSVSFSVELDRGENSRLYQWDDLTFEKELPLSVLREISKLVPADCEGLELDFDVTADIDYDPGCHTMRNGDPGWPPSYSDERTVNTVRLELPTEHHSGYSRGPSLSKASVALLEALYQKEIDDADLPEEDYDGPDEVDY